MYFYGITYINKNIIHILFHQKKYYTYSLKLDDYVVLIKLFNFCSSNQNSFTLFFWINLNKLWFNSKKLKYVILGTNCGLIQSFTFLYLKIQTVKIILLNLLVSHFNFFHTFVTKKYYYGETKF